MRIDVSKANCLPLSATSKEAIGGKCAGCKIEVSTGLQWHSLPRKKDEPQKRIRLCPLCHHSQHLDHAGVLNSGVMIWLPEIEQGTLNLICSLVFAATSEHREKSAASKTALSSVDDGDGAKDITEARQVQHLENIFRTFVSRSESLSAVTGFRNSTVDVTNPAFIAQMIIQARDKGKLSVNTIHERVDGLRYLPMPKAFVDFRKVVSKEVLSQFPLGKWLEMIPDHTVGVVDQGPVISLAAMDNHEAD